MENISLADAQELSKLQAQSAELERQLGLKEQLANIEGWKAAEDAKEAMNGRSSRNALDTNGEGWWTNIEDAANNARAWFNDITGRSEDTSLFDVGTADEVIIDRIEKAKTAQKELQDLKNKQTASDYKEVQADIEQQEKVVSNYITDSLVSPM